MIFKRSKVRLLRHTVTPGIKIGRYESGLDAVWAWRELAHLLVVERSEYGAGENLVAQIFRTVKCPKVLLWPKGETGWRETKDDEVFGLLDALEKLHALTRLAGERAERIEDGEDVLDMLVAIPELHDMADSHPAIATPEDKQFMADLAALLLRARAARIHVLANARQHVVYPAYLPAEIQNQFTGRLVLGETSDGVARFLGLPKPVRRPHARLGDLEDGFWPLEVRTR